MASKQRLLFLDFETYYDDKYSLREMPTPNYILDPRFETIMVSVKEDNGQTRVVDGPDFPAFLAGYDPAVTTTVTFNALFDNSILAWRYGFVPALMLDAMGMARALRGHELARFSLGAVAEHLGIGSKLGTLIKVKGMRRTDIQAAGLWKEFCEYATQDTDLTAAIFFKLIPEFPWSERQLMDMVIRCTVQPRFVVDTGMLRQHLQDVRDAKSAMLAVSGVGLDQLMSTQKFTAALESLGVVIQTKTSPTGKTIPALAKTDAFMEELQEHPDMRVQALACARLGHKSTLEETRSEKLLSIAELPWENYRDGNPRLYSGGTMPVPLRYGAAHTHRLGGDWGMNMQNLPTERGSKGKSKLRRALIAPPGHSIVVCDLGQIEARLTAWICRCLNLIRQFENKEDPYALLAEAIFGYKVDRKVQVLEGFIGKNGILGLGYGAGADKFFDMVIKLARNMGMDISGIGWSQALAKKSVETYRKVYSAIPRGWRTLDDILDSAWMGRGGPRRFGPVIIEKARVALPSGLFLTYGNPHVEIINYDPAGPVWAGNHNNGGQKVYTYGRMTHKIYGAKFLENIVQALARIIVMNAALRIRDRGHWFKLQAHDELVFIVPDAEVENAKLIIHTEMVRRPSWAPDLPLTASISHGKTYADAK